MPTYTAPTRLPIGIHGVIVNGEIVMDNGRCTGARLPPAKRTALMWLAVVTAFGTSAAWADVRVPRLVDDHMVLQRDSRVVLWGWADPGEKVQIAFHGRIVTTRTDRNGRWTTSLGPFAAGGPYDMVVAGKNRLVLHDVLLGDVWVASGQSNMEFALKAGGEEWMTGVLNSDQEVAGANFPQIRLFKVHRAVGFHPKDEVEADHWTSVTPESVGRFSAVAYFFGREIHQRYHAPVGLIETSWGGTVAEAWVSEAGLKSFPEFRAAIDSVNKADEKAVVAQHDRYKQDKAAWDRLHGIEDRGERDGRVMWADPAFDASSWATVAEPQSKPIEALKGFDGAVWFRREIRVRKDQVGNPVVVHLARAFKTDVTYFNGVKIGQTEGLDKPRDYGVPAGAVRPGQNAIVVHMTGSDGYVGMFDSDNPDRLNVEVGGEKIPLAGTWSYQPGADLQDHPTLSAMSELLDDPNASTVLFNAMIHPLIPFRIKGVIWYQGESNTVDNRSAQYRTLFPALIQDWRTHWGYQFPFLFVQLAGFGHNKTEPAEYPWADLREAQSMTLSVPQTGMATAVDIGDENDIHPRNKQDVAHRLALAAANIAYGEHVVACGPTYRSMQIEGDRIRIKFSNLGSGLWVNDKYGYARGFQIAGADGQFRWAQARQDGEDVVVFNAAIAAPVALRYDWSNTPDGNIYNREGLPAIPFRTDAPKP